MSLIDLVINGICTGIGTGIGSYLATRYAITHMKNIEEKINKNKTNNKII